MSRPQSQARVARPTGPARTSAAKAAELTPEQVLALPETIDGDNGSLDPDDASVGSFGIDGTISSAKFEKFVWPNKEGLDPIAPEIRLQIEITREGYDKPWRESLKLGKFEEFVASADGNFYKGRARKAPYKGICKPFKLAAAMIFLQSVKDAGFSAKTLNEKGIGALVGTKAHFTKGKVSGMHENARPILLVDFIDGGTAPVNPKPAAAASTTKAAPAKEVAAPAPSPTPAVTATAAAPVVAVDAELDKLASDALLDMIVDAGGTIARGAIAGAIIRNASWKDHAKRGAILKRIREDAFINMEGVAWTVAGDQLKA